MKHGLKQTLETGRPMEYCPHSVAHASAGLNYYIGECDAGGQYEQDVSEAPHRVCLRN